MELYVMSKDIRVAVYKNGELEILNAQLAPYYLVKTKRLESWLEHRAIDSHRVNSRLLKKALRLKEKDDFSTVISVNAVTITDTYWVKEIGSSLTYEDVRFKDDFFAELALSGGYDNFNNASNSKNKRTPELTNTGSFEKCWKLINGAWFMYKTANDMQMFSELFTYKLGKKLGFNMADYQMGEGYIKTRDFTNNAGVNFEPMFDYVNDDDDYAVSLSVIQKYCPCAVGDYIRILFMDTLVANLDRHTFNYGFLRNADTGEYIGLAPNFDNNLSLISLSYPRNVERKNDILIRLLVELINDNFGLDKYIPVLNRLDVEEVADSIPIDVNKSLVVDFVFNGYNSLIEQLDFKYMELEQSSFNMLDADIKKDLCYRVCNSKVIVRIANAHREELNRALAGIRQNYKSHCKY